MSNHISSDESSSDATHAAASDSILAAIPYVVCEFDCSVIHEDLDRLWPIGSNLDEILPAKVADFLDLRQRLVVRQANPSHFETIEQTANWLQTEYRGSREHIHNLGMLFKIIRGELPGYSWTFEAKDNQGEIIHFHSNLTVSRRNQERVHRILYTSIDITQSVLETQRQLEEKDRFRMLLDVAPALIVELNVLKFFEAIRAEIKGQKISKESIARIDPRRVLEIGKLADVVYQNADSIAVLGHVTAAQILKAVVDAGSENQARRFAGYVTGILERDRIGPMPITYITPSGEQKRYSHYIVAAARTDGIPDRIIFAGTDVTEAYEAEMNREIQRLEFTRRLDSAPIPIIEFNTFPFISFVSSLQAAEPQSLASELKQKGESKVMEVLSACKTVYANSAATQLIPFQSLGELIQAIPSTSDLDKFTFLATNILRGSTAEPHQVPPLDLAVNGAEPESYVLQIAVEDQREQSIHNITIAATNVEAKKQARLQIQRLLSDHETLFATAPILAREEDLTDLTKFFREVESQTKTSIEDAIKADKSIFFSNLHLAKTVRISNLASEFYEDVSLAGVLQNSVDAGETSCALRFISQLRGLTGRKEIDPYVFKVKNRVGRWKYLLVTMRALDIKDGWPTRLLTMELDVTRRTILQEIHREINAIGVGFRGTHYLAELLRTAVRVIGAYEGSLALGHVEFGGILSWVVEPSGRLVQNEDEDLADRLSIYAGRAVITDHSPELMKSDGSDKRSWVASYPIRNSQGIAIGDIRLSFRDVTLTEMDVSATLRIIAEAAEAEITRSLVESRMRRHNELLEQNVKERTAQLSELNRELEAFNYSISHDLRAPARQVAIYASEIKSDSDSALSPSSIEDLNRIEELAAKMGTMTNALLTFSRLGRASVDKNEVDWTQQVSDAIAAVGREYGQKACYEVDVHPTEYCDDNLIGIVLQNLISNATKYSSQQTQPTVRIGSYAHQGILWHFVEDNGIGFPESQSHRLFQPFQRLSGATEFSGTGVGLATVQRVIENHGGRIRASNIDPHGARFDFTLGTEIERLGGGDRIRTGE
ncbi:ATP-binding protein [Kamptonema cortianum]|nr:ATP-binding protein [Geitlerinema splendidum]MDK3160435.1 ATP-binding protein [Kamptonema cortianum]